MGKQTRADREETKKRAAEERAKQEALDRRRRLTLYGVGAVIIVAIAVSVGIAISSQNSNSGSSSGPAPAIATSDNGGIPIGPTADKAAAAGIPTVDVYEDFQCPACKQFEAQSSSTLQGLAKDGKARVVYHPINLIGSQQTSEPASSSSLRAGSAFGCATTTTDFMAWHDIAFKNQPAEGTGITDAQLVEWGNQAGVTDASFATCVTDQKYVGWVKRVDAQSGKKGVTGTPSVFVNGKELTRSPNQYTPAGITAAVAAATKSQ
jgi:protein-disulfide isomerase